MTPTVSIVIPTFNGEAFLDQTLASVRKQGFADWEIIAVDDGSGDGTMDILRRNLERIQFSHDHIRQRRSSFGIRPA